MPLASTSSSPMPSFSSANDASRFRAGNTPMIRPWPWASSRWSWGCEEWSRGSGRIAQSGRAGTFARRYRQESWRGYGATAKEILAKIHGGVGWQREAAAVFGGEGSMGNGAAMRVAPLGAYFAD